MEPIENTAKDDDAVLIAAGVLEYPVCRTCGSENVACDAWAKWNRTTQQWELDQTFDDAECRNCDGSCKIEWKQITETATDRTRRLNDEMRAGILTGGSEAYGTVVMTRGVADCGHDFVARVGKAVASFDAFDRENDPYAEHDFGAFDIDHQKLFFKIDYYSLDMKSHSPDKSDVGVTHRVLTIMLASEY